MASVAKRVGDKRLLSFIRAFLNAGVMENGLVSPTDEGTPQGGPLSPLLSNFVLDKLIENWTSEADRFVRYADDCNIYVQSQRAGQRVMEKVTGFVSRKLKLKVNAAKSGWPVPGSESSWVSTQPVAEDAAVAGAPDDPKIQERVADDDRSDDVVAWRL